ncbi:MAG: ABC transporter ATP-binding protein [Clostridiales bacterium]|nr:ABC transporter ATP-binding protein [Clostridiales bacterium]
MKRVFRYIWKYKLFLIIPFCAMLLGVVLDMLNPYIAGTFVDKVILKKQLNILWMVLAGVGGVSAGRMVLGYVKEYMYDILSSKVAVDLRKDLFDHIQELPFKFFDNMSTGELMSRMTGDIDNIWRSISFGIGLFVENAIYFITAGAILFTLNVKLTLISLFTMPLIAYIAFKLEKRVDEAYQKLSDQGVILNTTAEENIAGVRLVKAFGREKHEICKFLRHNKKNADLSIEQARIWGTYHPMIEFLGNFTVIAVVSIGGLLVINENISIGTLVAFNGYIWMLIWPMRNLGFLTNVIAQASASSKKIFKIMDVEPAIKDPEKPVHVDSIKGDVAFENVSFKYNDSYVLKNIDINAKKGSTIAIMGATGSGKSSIINLIGRYYDVTEGRITIDGFDVRDMQLKTIRENMAVVMQDTFLFSDTINENIRFGCENASDEDVLEAAKDASVDKFVSEMEDGYETIIGERGVGLSGGQKQRVSIARALLKNARILILDDATSALDMETEYEVLKAIKRRRRDCTTFIIAHRISAVKDADEILIIDNGQIVEHGSHKELLKKQGRYYQIFSEQFKDIGFDNEEVI